MLQNRGATIGSVILNFDSPEDTVASVQALLGGTRLDLVVVVVDNNPDEQAQASLKRQLPPGISYLPTGDNVGYAKGCNLGVTHVLERGVEYVITLNPDAWVARDTVDDLLRAAAAVPDAGFLGPRLVLRSARGKRVIQGDGGTIDWSAYGRTTHLNAGRRPKEAPARLSEVDYVPGACVLSPRRLFEDVGLLTEDYFLYFEETDHAVRAARRGWVSVVDSTTSVLHHRRSAGKLPSRTYIYYLTRNRAIFAARHVARADAIDGAYADLDEHFLDPWRSRVNSVEPRLADVFDRVVELAKDHGRRQLTGRYDGLGEFAAEGVKGWESE